MKKLLLGFMVCGIAALLAAPASAGLLLIDDFNDQDTTSPLLMSDGVTYGSWSVTAGVLEFAEVGGAGSGNYAIRPGTSYAEFVFNTSDYATYQLQSRIAEADWPTGVTHFEFRIYNLNQTARPERNLLVTLAWQNSSEPTAHSGRRRVAYTVSLPEVAAGDSFLVQLPLSYFTTIGGDTLGTENNVMIGTIRLEDSGNSYFYDDFAFTTVPEPATMGLLGLGLVGLIARKKR